MNIKSVLKLVEVKTLAAGLFPVLLGSVYSFYEYEKINYFYLIALVIAMALIQASTNMFNDFMDFHRGEDKEKSIDEKVLVSGELKASQIPFLIALCMGFALIIGLIIASQTSWKILLVAVIGAGVAGLYSSGPKPISYTPFGEIIAGITMGMGITSTVVFIQSEQFQWQNIWMAVPTTIYISYILLTNNLCDREKDMISGRHTFPGIIGFKRAKNIWLLCCGVLAATTTALVIAHIYPIWTLLTLIILWNYKFLFNIKQYEQEEFQKQKMMGVIGKIGAQFHILLISGFLIAIIIKTF